VLLLASPSPLEKMLEAASDGEEEEDIGNVD
jgi:hypothetical protein